MSYINIADILWPIGSLYWTRGESPSNLFGGTWVKVSDSILYPTTEETYETNIVGSNDFNINYWNLPDRIAWAAWQNSFDTTKLINAGLGLGQIKAQVMGVYESGGAGFGFWMDQSNGGVVVDKLPKYPISPGQPIEYIPARTLCHCYQRIA